MPIGQTSGRQRPLLAGPLDTSTPLSHRRDRLLAVMFAPTHAGAQTCAGRGLAVMRVRTRDRAVSARLMMVRPYSPPCCGVRTSPPSWSTISCMP